jgi:hypothetical protein
MEWNEGLVCSCVQPPAQTQHEPPRETRSTSYVYRSSLTVTGGEGNRPRSNVSKHVLRVVVSQLRQRSHGIFPVSQDKEYSFFFLTLTF